MKSVSMKNSPSNRNAFVSKYKLARQVFQEILQQSSEYIVKERKTMFRVYPHEIQIKIIKKLHTFLKDEKISSNDSIKYLTLWYALDLFYSKSQSTLLSYTKNNDSNMFANEPVSQAQVEKFFKSKRFQSLVDFLNQQPYQWKKEGSITKNNYHPFLVTPSPVLEN